jgi:hypothetical protein
MMNNNEIRKQLLEIGPGQEVDGFELCDCCMDFSPGIGMDGETITHCPLCGDRHIITVAAADYWRKEMAGRYGRRL